MSKLLYKGTNYAGFTSVAENVVYDNSDSGLEAINAQDAIDEIITNYSLWESGTGEHSIQTKDTGALATGDSSVAEGLNTVAGSNYSHAEGITTKTVIDESDSEFHGYASHAEGAYTTAKGAASHAEGDGTLAIAMHSHAEGRTTTTGGEASHAEGSNTITNNFGEHAEGVYNLSNTASNTFGDAGNTLHSIGIGSATGELEDDRKNAFEVMQNGDAYLIGVGGYDGTNPNNADRIQDFLTKKLISLTQSEYDALPVKNPNTVYLIID